ncbi:hypothetical protein Gotur_017745 [Gossypium turneri]
MKDLLLWFVAMRMVQIKCLFRLLVSLIILNALNMSILTILTVIIKPTKKHR